MSNDSIYYDAKRPGSRYVLVLYIVLNRYKDYSYFRAKIVSSSYIVDTLIHPKSGKYAMSDLASFWRMIAEFCRLLLIDSLFRLHDCWICV